MKNIKSFLYWLFRVKIMRAEKIYKSISQIDGLRAVRELLETGQWDAADTLGTQLLSVNQDNCELLALLAYSLQQRGRSADAAEMATQAVLLNDNQWLPNFIAGIALKACGHEERARAYLRRAWAIRPNDEQTMREFLTLESGLGGIDSALQALEQMPERRSTKVCPIVSVMDWSKRRGVTMLDAGNIETIPFVTPKIWGDTAPEERLFSKGNKPFVTMLSNARIYSACSFILTDDHYLLSDLAGHPQYGELVSFAGQPPIWGFGEGKVLLDTSAYCEQEIEGGIWLAGLASNAFGHWIPEFLPKLEFLMQHPEFANLSIIIDEGMPPSHIDYLNRITNNSLIVQPPGVCFVCRLLLVAPSPTFYPCHLKHNTIPQHEIGALSPRALRFLRASVNALPTPTEAPLNRIFIGRRNMQWRRLLNEKEIAEALGQKGFNYVYPEDLDLAQQIALFKAARWIVAPNGSSLLNLIFSEPSTRILILSQPNLYNWGNFQGPMEELGYHPLFVCGRDTPSQGKHSDYEVPIPLILKALSKMGLDQTEG
jgi:tetratricopeptide (TPR) repeat protein